METPPLSDDPTVAALQQKLGRLNQELSSKLQALARLQTGPDPDETFNARHRMFVDFLLPPNTEERLNFEIRWAEYLKEQLELMHAKVLDDRRAAKLSVPQPSKLIVPGRG